MLQFKRRIRWGGVLKTVGLVALGYFIGRPDQLERLARNLNNYAGATRTVYLRPIVTGTAPELVQIQQDAGQPEVVKSSSPGQYGWNDFYHQEGRFSIVVPPRSVKEVTDLDGGKRFSIETENEFYLFSYSADIDGVRFISQDRKQAALQEASKVQSSGFDREFQPIAQRSFALNGNPGLETHFQHKSKPIKLISRKMFVGDRLYGMAVGSPHHQYTQVFMNSFRVH